jgi:type VI secretion system secreted protein VgrG
MVDLTSHRHAMPNRSETIQGQDELTISAGQRVRIGAASDTAVGTNLTLNITGNQAVWVQGVVQHKTGKAHSLSAKQVTVEATDQLVLRCGAASIVLSKGGDIEIIGKDLTLKASGKFSAKASGDATVRGNKIADN